MSTVEMKHVTKYYGQVQVLKEFTDVFGDGEFVTLLGPSGCGKTTMLRMIAGFETPTSGQILIDGQTVFGEGVFIPPEKRGVGMVFQSYAIWPHMNVFDNVAYPLKVKKNSREEIRQKVMHMLEVVHLDQYADRMPNQLSGGQQQRVALARALCASPRLLLLDEPLSNLDARLRETMRFEIKDITKSMGISVVYVTHDQMEAMAMSDRIFLINNGIVQQSGTPDEIYHHPVNPFVADFLGKVDFFQGTMKKGSVLVNDWNMQLPWSREQHSGNVLVAIRPENILIDPEQGTIAGTVTKRYYLGDVADFRVRVGAAMVRVIVDGHAFSRYTEGDQVRLTIREFLVYDDDNTQDLLKIRT